MLDSSHCQARRPRLHVEEVIVEAVVAGRIGRRSLCSLSARKRSVVSVTLGGVARGR